jgi:hypothetical protein
LSRSYYTRLLSGGNSLNSAAILIVFSEPNFNEYQSLLVEHDQVQLTTSTAIITANQLKSLLNQKLMRAAFSRFAFEQMRRLAG